MLDTWAELSGVELVNGMRLRALLAAAECAITAVKGAPCESLHDAIEPAADWGDPTLAPWYDPSLPESARFYGFEVVAADGLGDTRRSVGELEGAANGRVFVSQRKKGIDAKFRVVLFAADRQALDYGRSWLSQVLDGKRCGESATGECELMTLTLLADCPTDAASVPGLTRQMLRAACTDGPTAVDSATEISGGYMLTVEFTLGSEMPALYSVGGGIPLGAPGAGENVVLGRQNLILNPRGRKTSAVAVVGYNEVTDPFCTVGTQGWATVPAVSAPTNAAKTAGMTGAIGSRVIRFPAVYIVDDGSQFLFRGSVRRESAAFAVVAGESVYAQLDAIVNLTRTAGAPTAQYISNAQVGIIFNDPATTRLRGGNANITIPGAGGTNWIELRGIARGVVPAGATQAKVYLEYLYGNEPGGSPHSAVFLATFADITDIAFIREGFVPRLTDADAGAIRPYPGQSGMRGLSFAWAGAANASRTVISGPTPDDWIVPVVAAPATPNHITLPDQSGVWFVSAPNGEEKIKTSGEVVPGTVYFPRLRATAYRLNGSGAMEARVEWRTAANVLISTSALLGTITPPAEGAAVEWVGPSVTAPATAAIAYIKLSNPASEVNTVLTNAQLSPRSAGSFFDGDSLPTATERFEWSGTPRASSSRALPILVPSDDDPLRDPDCPPLPAPPQPPTIADPCASEVLAWRRYRYAIGAASIPEMLELLPTILLSSPVAFDAIRVRLVANPEGLPVGDVPITDEVFWEITYLPANITLELDALFEETRAVVADEELPADHLVLGVAGAPPVWPSLSCAQGYVLAIDIPDTANIANLNVSMNARREYA